MPRFNRPSRQALLVSMGFLALLALFVLATSISLKSMSSVNQGMEHLVKEVNAKYQHMTRMRDMIRERMVTLFALVYTEDPFLVEAQWEKMSYYASQFLEARENLYNLELTDAQLDQLETQRELLAIGQETMDHMVKLVREGRHAEARKEILEVRNSNDQLLRELSEMREFQQQLARRAMAEASTNYQETRRKIILLNGLALVLGGMVVLFVVYRITTQERELAKAVNALGEAKDKLEQRVQERTAELMSARDEAVEASRTKSRFLANMSHELRTPLNAIIGYCEILREECEDESNEAMLDDLEKIHAAGRHLLELINDILDISKIEAGKIKIHPEYFDLEDLIKDVTHTMQPLMEAKKNHLTIDRHQLDTSRMFADQMRVRQVLYNLLSNANKFTDQGTITLELRETQRDGTPWISFRVTDTGIGISPENQKKLFRPFTQVDPSTTRKYGGTGLGLIISLRFCQLMGGNIGVESEIGKGCRFTVTLPLHVEPREIPEDHEAESQHRCMAEEENGDRRQDNKEGPST